MTIINPNSISGISSITALNSTAAINLFKADGTSANIIAGVVTATSLDISGDIDVDGHTELDNVKISGIASVHNTLRFTHTGGGHIDHGAVDHNLNFRVSKSSTADTTMMQINASSENTKFRKYVTVGLQGGDDTAVLGGGSGIGAYLQLNYASNSIVNTKLLGNGNSWLNSNYGNLGIGTAVAGKKLHVFGSNSHPVILERGDNANTQIELKTAAATRGYWGASDTANFMVYDNDASDVNFTVLQTGQIGIGNIVPDTWSTGHGLTIGTSQATLWGVGDQVNLSGNAYFNSGWKAAATKAGASQIQQALGNIDFRVTGSINADAAITWTEAVRITPAGVIGINDTNPGTGKKVKVVVDNNSSYQMAVNLTNNVNADINFYIKTNESLIAPSTNTPLCLGMGGAEKLRITSNGRVGINTTTDSMDGVTGNLNIANTNFNNHTVINLSRNTAADRNQIRFQNTNGNIGSIDTFGSDLIVSSGNALKFRTNGNERLEIKSDGNIIHSSTEAFQIAKGTTAQRPSSPVVGMVRFNTTTNALENYNSNGWANVNTKIPIISSITGNIYAGMATNLTINGNSFDTTVTVTFKEGATTRGTLTNQSVSSGSLTVAVPSGVYGQSAGDTITITITNTDGTISSGVNKTIQTSPSGGTITTSGNYRIHSFTSSGNFVNTVASLGVEYLVIAGGGAGGSAGNSVAGGGGGAGGYRSNVSGQSSGGGNSAESAMTLSAATFAVVVGAGAAATPGTSDQGGVRGSNSSFNSIVSTGGGGGGGNGADSSQASGGSGGGGKESNGTGGSGTSGQGYNGGNGSESGNSGGGGGGAGEAGNTDGLAFGGDGVSSNITGSSVTRAGGGGSGSNTGAHNSAVGGTGGGGDGGKAHDGSANPVSGTANTGGGGGGGFGISVGASGAGGSGIVIIRYNTTTIS